MKKIILSIVSICLFSVTTMAQSTTERVFDKYRFSIFAGPSFNSLKPANASADSYNLTKKKGNVGFSFGLNAEWNLNDRYTAYTGLGITTRGGSINAAKSSIDSANNIYLNSANVTYKLKYLTIPLGLKLKAAQIDKMKIFAQTGLDLGILISQKGDFNGNLYDGTPAIVVSNAKLNDVAKSVPVNLGWCIGLGGEYAFSREHSAYATLLYRNGITDVTTPNSNKAGYKFSDGNIRSNSFVICIGYYF